MGEEAHEGGEEHHDAMSQDVCVEVVGYKGVLGDEWVGLTEAVARC